MLFQHNKENKPIKQSNLYDPKERERLLMQYQGIFKRNIPEFAKKVIKSQAKLKNYAK